MVGFGAGWQLIRVPGDSGSAEWAFGLALLSGLGDESLPPAPVGGGCGAVGVCHRVPRSSTTPLWALTAPVTAWNRVGVCLPHLYPANRFWGTFCAFGGGL